jgi:hypothetical protein
MAGMPQITAQGASPGPGVIGPAAGLRSGPGQGLRPGQRGSLVVELALVLPVLLVLLVAMAGVTQYQLASTRVAHAAFLGQAWSARGLDGRAVKGRVCGWLQEAGLTGTCRVVRGVTADGDISYTVRYRFEFAFPLLDRAVGDRWLEGMWMEMSPAGHAGEEQDASGDWDAVDFQGAAPDELPTAPDESPTDPDVSPMDAGESPPEPGELPPEPGGGAPSPPDEGRGMNGRPSPLLLP